jgi:exopolysaccharide biosynthesis polyprenyl glycosylphosphotransferase
VLKNYWKLISRLERILDNALIIAAFFLSYHFRDSIFSLPIVSFFLGRTVSFPVLGAIENYLIILGCSLPLYSALLSIFGAYRSMRFVSYWKLTRIFLVSSLLVFFALGSILFVLKLDLSRSFIGIFCALSGIGLFLIRIFVLACLRFFRIRGKNYRNLLIVGTGEQARQLYLEISSQPVLGVRIVGFTELDNNETSATYDLGGRIISNRNTFESALKRYAVDEVLFTEVIEKFAQINELAKIAAEEGVRITLAADLFSLNIFKSEISFFGTTPLIHYNPSPTAEQSTALAVKRIFDVVVSSILLVVFSPLFIVTALLIKIESSGPIFFRQKRVGLNGRIFVLLKFRSMVENAEEMLGELKSQNEMSGPVFKMKNDPRITQVGRFIRKFSIDELPQLLNVVFGDMSLVGPRPPLPDEVSLYERKHRKRLSMRPGLTCIWQVSGRNDIPDFNRWAELDLEYIDNWSLKFDLLLLIKTIPVVIFGNGAR